MKDMGENVKKINIYKLNIGSNRHNQVVIQNNLL